MTSRLSNVLVGLWVLVFIAGICLVFWGITHESLWYDETYTAAMTDHPILDIIRFSSGDVHSPFYYILVRIFRMIFGKSALSLRAFSALGLLALAGLGFGPVRRIFGHPGGLLFAFLVFITPVCVSMAQNARMYTWACFFVTAAVLYGYLAMAEDTKNNWRLFGLFTVFALYIHLYALLAMVMSYGIMLVWILLYDRKKLKPLLITAGIVSLAYLPWLIVLLSQISRVTQDFWIPEPDWELKRRTFLYPFSNKFSFSYNSSLVHLSLLMSGILLFKSIKNAVIQRETREAKLVFLALLVPIAVYHVVMQISTILRPIFYPRYFFTLLGLYFLVMMAGILSFSSRLSRFVVCLIILVLYTPEIYHLYLNRFNGPMSEAVDYLQERLSPDDVFVHGDEHPFGTFSYYLPHHKHYLYLAPGFEGYMNYEVFAASGGSYGHDYREFIRGKQTVWLVNRFGEMTVKIPQLSEEEFLQNGTFYQASLPRRFTLPSSWYMFRVTRFTADPKEALNESTFTVKTLKITASGFRNNTGKAICRVFEKDVYYLYRNYLRHDRIPEELNTDFFEKYAYAKDLLNDSEKQMLLRLYQKNEVKEVYTLTKPVMYEDRKMFQKIGAKLRHETSTPIQKNDADFLIEDLDYEYYYILIFHDENDNGQLDLRRRWPKEGVGLSNVTSPFRTPPTFDAYSILPDREHWEVQIPIHYFYGKSFNVFGIEILL